MHDVSVAAGAAVVVNRSRVHSLAQLLVAFYGADAASALRAGFRVRAAGGIAVVEYAANVQGVAASARHFFPRTWSLATPANGTSERLPRPPDLEATVHYSLEELFTGGERRVQLIRHVTRDRRFLCREPFTCAVPVRPGFRVGTRLKLRGAGNTIVGCARGDVVFTVAQKPHRCFTRVGAHLRVSFELTLADALRGPVVAVPTIDGHVVALNGAAILARHLASRADVFFTVAGAGMPHFHNPALRGDLIVRFVLRYPQQRSLSLTSVMAPLPRTVRAHSSLAAPRQLPHTDICAMWCEANMRQVSPALRIQYPTHSCDSCANISSQHHSSDCLYSFRQEQCSPAAFGAMPALRPVPKQSQCKRIRRRIRKLLHALLIRRHHRAEHVDGHRADAHRAPPAV